MNDECTVFSLIVFTIVLGITLALVMYPYPHSDYYRDAHLIHGETRGRTNCTIGETYDNNIDICVPILESFLPELVDKNVRPCTSFFNHISGEWIKTHHNENRAFTYIFRKNQKYIHDIIRDPHSGPVYEFYRSCLDTIVHKQHMLLDKQQYNHVYEHIMGALKTHGDLPVVFARLTAYGFGAPLMVSVETHPTKPRMVPLIRADYPLNVTTTMDIDFPLTMIYDLEQCIKKLEEWDNDDDDINNMEFIDYLRSTQYKQDMTTMSAILDASTMNFWKQYFRELNGYKMEEDIDNHAQEQPVWLLNRHFIMNLIHHIDDISLREWKAYVEYSIRYYNQQYVPNLPNDSYFKFHNPIRRNARFRYRMLRERRQPTEHTCLAVTHKVMPGIIGNIFLDRYMKNYEHVKQRITVMVENIRDAFVDMLRETWLSEETREQITEKLEAIIIRVVHPNYYEEEVFADRMTKDCYLRNINIIRRYFATRNFELWTTEKPNRDLVQRFGSPITTANAFYSPVTNTITIFGGILTEPIYSDSYDDLDLYATIGMIIAHELAHSLDNNGRLFDKDGSFLLKDPWKPEEVHEFNQRIHRLMLEYEAPMGCPNTHYGEQTIGEDLSDLNGIQAAIRAYKKQGGTDMRRFFSIFGQMWTEVYTKDIYCERVKDDVHAIAMYRVDKTLRQLKEFREAFNCQEHNEMVNQNPVVIY